MSEPAKPQVTLRCVPGKQDHELVFPYEVDNAGPGAILVSAAYHGVDAATHQPFADHDTLVIARQLDGYALVMRGVPPRPPYPVNRPIFPLVRRVEAGTQMKAEMRAPLPLAEADPYRPYGNIRAYVESPIEGIRVAVDWIAENAPGLTATPAEGAEGLATLYAPSLATMMTRATCLFPTRSLSLLVRKE